MRRIDALARLLVVVFTPFIVGTLIPFAGPCRANADAFPPSAAHAAGLMESWLSRDRLWVDANYLLWWTSGMDLPPLLTSRPAGPTLPLGQDDFQELFGGNSVLDGSGSGWRIDTGLWLDTCRNFAIEFDYLRLASLDDSFSMQPDSNSIVTRPFTDAVTGQPDGELVTYPGLVSGDVGFRAASGGLEGWGVALRSCLVACGECCCQDRLDLVLGYRHYRLGDAFDIQERLTSPLFVPGSLLVLNDNFAAQNTFDGAEIGLLYQRQRQRLRLGGRAKVALGATNSRVRIDGNTTIMTPGMAPLVYDGGLYALSSNMGVYEANEFTAILETGVDVGYQLTRDLSVQVGYTFLLWPGVYRAGEQIDTVINTAFLPPPLSPAPGPARPAPVMRDGTFWAQGLQIGLTYRF